MCWDFTGKEIGLIKSAEPVKIRVKPDAVYPRTRQVKLSKKAEEGMKHVINQMLEQGILKEVWSSPCNSPVMDLKKTSGKWRILQDVRKIDKIVVPCCPVVPNRTVILFQIPADARHRLA